MRQHGERCGDTPSATPDRPAPAVVFKPKRAKVKKDDDKRSLPSSMNELATNELAKMVQSSGESEMPISRPRKSSGS